MLADAIDSVSISYDCLIVDEAQDFLGEWWIPMVGLLADQKSSEIFIFRDSNQNIFSRDNLIPIENMVTIKLNKNYRNTPAITKWINDVCATKIIPSERIDEGIEPKTIKVTDGAKEFESVQTVVSRLIKKEQLNPGQIVILGRHPLKRSVFGSFDSIGGFRLIEGQLPANDPNSIRYSSVYKFKGLESDCVLFTGLGADGRDDIQENMKSVLLTGASRAKSLLYVFDGQIRLHSKFCLSGKCSPSRSKV